VSRSTRGGYPATAFTHVVHGGGATYLQYWFYYPDSTTTWGGLAAVWSALDVVRSSSYPGFHHDDWEGYQVRIDASGRALARATAHHGYTYCKDAMAGCANRWGPWTGWTRVSRGSHAGHIPMAVHRVPIPGAHGPHAWRAVVRPTREGIDVHERTTRSSELRLVPLEAIDPRSYHSADPHGPVPPWGKDVYRTPAINSTG
jgi:hypothetical protein